jgi:hypothetical protein
VSILADISRKLSRIERAVFIEGVRTVTALEDLAQVDADLAAAVTDLSASVERIDADFVKLEDAVANGNFAAIEAEVANLRATVDAAKAAKASIEATDPPAPPVL